MNSRSAIILVAVVSLVSACGPRRIRKLPVPREQEIRAVRLVAEGDLLLRDGKDHLAMLKYLEASQSNPYHEVIFNKLAVTYSRLQMFFQAWRSVDRAIGLDPDYAFAYNTKGILQLTEGNIKAALRSFERAISLDSSVANFYINLGFAYIQSDRSEEGLEAYQTALEIDPELFENKDFIELSYHSEHQITADQYYELARVFADLESLEYCIRYLGKAFAAGFDDYEKIREDEVFEKFLREESFVAFLKLHGVLE